MTEKIFETFPYADVYAPPKFKDISEYNLYLYIFIYFSKLYKLFFLSFNREINYRKNPPPKEIAGNIAVRGNGTDQRFVINMFTQDFPRAPTA